ncbi:transposase, partial [Corynebacterium coyleae]
MPRKYSDQFRQQCIDEVLMFGKTRGAVAQEYGVSSSSLGRWVAKAEGT